MKLLKNKKGILFTLMALLLSALFIIILIPDTSVKFNSDSELQKARAVTIRSYHDYIQEYVDYAIKIPANHCLNAIAQNMIDENTFYADFDDFEFNMQMCLLNSAIFNVTSMLIPPLIWLNNLENQSMRYVMDQLVNLTLTDYGINTVYSFKNLQIFQVEPDEFEVFLEYQFTLSGSDFVLQPGRYNTTVQINFEGVLDPMYTMKTGHSKYFEDILLIDIPYQENNGLLNIPFEEFVNKASYVQYQTGTSIKNRFINELDSSDLSLISFINQSDVSYHENWSYVDIEYFRGTNFTCDKLYCLDDNNDDVCDEDEGFRVDAYTLFGLSSSVSGFNLSTNNWIPLCED